MLRTSRERSPKWMMLIIHGAERSHLKSGFTNQKVRMLKFSNFCNKRKEFLKLCNLVQVLAFSDNFLLFDMLAKLAWFVHPFSRGTFAKKSANVRFDPEKFILGQK